MSIDLATAVEDFWSARGRGEFFPQAYFDRLDLDDAYRIQLGLIDRRVAAWGALRANWIYLKVGARWGLGFRKGLEQQYPDVR